jgi:hypothetical protein
MHSIKELTWMILYLLKGDEIISMILCFFDNQLIV